MTILKKLLVMMICFWITEVAACKTPWSDRARQLYLRNVEELEEARHELEVYKRREQERLLLSEESRELQLDLKTEYLQDTEAFVDDYVEYPKVYQEVF